MPDNPAETEVNTIQDILTVLERDPGLQEELWRRLATPRMLNLPAVADEILARQARTETRQDRLERAMEKLAEAQARTEERQARMEERQDRLEAAMAMLAEGQARMEERQDRLEAAMSMLAEGQARMEERQDRLEAAMAKLSEAQARTEERQDRLETAMAKLAEAQARTENNLNEVKGRINLLTGTVYQQRAARIARRRTKRSLGMTDAKTIHLDNNMLRNAAESICEEAESQGLLSEEEAEELEEIDLIIHDQASDTYAADEISISLDANDATRAKRRAELLAAATRAKVNAILVGSTVLDECREAAEKLEITIITIPQAAQEESR